MAATPQEQQLLIQLAELAAGQAPGSFGPGQAYALLAGYIKLRDRVDLHGTSIAAAQTAIADHDARLTALEQWKTTVDDAIADLEQRVAALEQTPTA